MEDAQTRSECGVIVKRLPCCRAIYKLHVSVFLLTAFAIINAIANAKMKR